MSVWIKREWWNNEKKNLYYSVYCYSTGKMLCSLRSDLIIIEIEYLECLYEKRTNDGRSRRVIDITLFVWRALDRCSVPSGPIELSLSSRVVSVYAKSKQVWKEKDDRQLPGLNTKSRYIFAALDRHIWMVMVQSIFVLISMKSLNFVVQDWLMESWVEFLSVELYEVHYLDYDKPLLEIDEQEEGELLLPLKKMKTA